ncbi:MAG: hypothetical protein KJ569_06790 [Candidatus Omnitrophica bacterium]|nr:hypothetical protein [Candidatus Omnitrophota bacterium]
MKKILLSCLIFILLPIFVFANNLDGANLQSQSQYKDTIKSIKFVGIKNFSESTILEMMHLQEGDIYNSTYIQQDLDKLKELYFQNGYINVRAEVDIEKLEEESLVNIKYSVTENDPVFIKEIIIKGNKEIEANTILRELDIKSGKPYNGLKLKNGRERLLAFSSIRDVSFNIGEITEDQKADLIINIREISTAPNINDMAIKLQRSKAYALAGEEKYHLALPKLKQIVELFPTDAKANMDYGSILFASASQYFKRNQFPMFKKTALPILKESTIYLRKATQLYGATDKKSTFMKSHAYDLLGDIYYYGLLELNLANEMYQQSLEVISDNEYARDGLKCLKVTIKLQKQGEDFRLIIWKNQKHSMEISHPNIWFIKKIEQRGIFQVFFSLENIETEQYYHTGITVNKLYNHTPRGAKFNGNRFIDSVVSDLNKNKGLINEKREKIITEHGYEGMLAKIEFINYKGKREIEYMAVFGQDTTMVEIICEAPYEDFSKYDILFKEIIMTAKLFNN